jgi:hypothetical protein
MKKRKASGQPSRPQAPVGAKTARRKADQGKYRPEDMGPDYLRTMGITDGDIPAVLAQAGGRMGRERAAREWLAANGVSPILLTSKHRALPPALATKAAALLARMRGGTAASGEPQAIPAAEFDEVTGKGVAPRNRWILEQYKARGTETYHKPAKIHAKWVGMTATERAAICPDCPNRIAKSTVATICKRDRKKP